MADQSLGLGQFSLVILFGILVARLFNSNAFVQGWKTLPVPVIGYHEFGGPPEYKGGPQFDSHGLNIKPSDFRIQLESMYKNGYWPINLDQFAQKRFSVPKGRRPIVLTFDDGRPTQFRYLSDGRIDPNCAVGILLEFRHNHPGWPLRGTFYLIAGSDDNGVPFDQEGLEKMKVDQLLRWGFEIGNHSLTHPSFATLSRREIEKEVAGGQDYLEKLVPGLKIDSFALPYGILPRRREDEHLLRSGAHRRRKYLNVAVALFDGNLSVSPYEPTFNPMRISRIAPSPGNVEKVVQN